MHVTAWKNGPLGSLGLIFGIRVGAKNAQQFFDRKWTNIVVELGRLSITVNLSSSFWRNCPELRNLAFEEWMRSLRLIPWKPQHPPRLTLTPLGGKSLSVGALIKKLHGLLKCGPRIRRGANRLGGMKETVKILDDYRLPDH